MPSQTLLWNAITVDEIEKKTSVISRKANGSVMFYILLGILCEVTCFLFGYSGQNQYFCTKLDE